MAIEQGMTILSWFENLPKEDVPPEYLWEDGEGLEQWWATVENKREDGMPTSRGRALEHDEDSSDRPQEMAENEFARHFKD